MKAVWAHLIWGALILGVAYSQRTVAPDLPKPPTIQTVPEIETKASTQHVELRKHPHSTEISPAYGAAANEVVAMGNLPEKEQEFPVEPKQKIEIFHLENDMRTYDCQGQAVELLASDAQLQFTGYCPYLVISGPNGNIQADRVHVLKVYGPDSTVSVNAVDFVDVVAPDSKVNYGRELDTNKRVRTRVSGPNSRVQRR